MKGNWSKTLRWLIMTGLFLNLVFACSPATQAVKRGDELLEMKNYYGASQQYLYALRLEADHKDAKKKLCLTAKQAYDQKYEMAAGYEKSSDYESALLQYAELQSYIENLDSQNCLNFLPVNAKQKVTEMKSGASEKHYKEAEQYFKDADYNNAIASYGKALQLNNPYKDSTEKIAESYYRLATKDESQRSWRDSAANYLKANETISGYKDAAAKATATYYSLGLSFLKKGLCRNAYDDLSTAAKINADFKDMSTKMTEAEACSISKIAFVRFDNLTHRNVAGMSIGDLIFDDIKSRLQNKASKFIRTIDRNELSSILAEQKLGMSGITDDYATFKQLKGVHYLVFGKLTQVNVEQPNEKIEYMKTNGQEPYPCTRQGRNGQTYQANCYRDITINYTQHTAKLNVALTGSIKVISVSTGEQIVFQSIGSKRSDSVTYADVTTDMSPDTSRPDFLWALMKARRELVDKDGLVKDMIAEIDNEMVQKILQKLDSAKTVSDPVDLLVIR